jgi:hypothetical protein
MRRQPCRLETYEARDAQFQLPVPSPDAVGVRIYAANFRTGRDALGTFDLRPAPPPVPSKPAAVSFVKDPKPPAASSFVKDPKPPAAKPAPANGAAVASLQENDRIARSGFDDQHAAAPATRTDKPAGGHKDRNKAAGKTQDRQ